MQRLALVVLAYFAGLAPVYAAAMAIEDGRQVELQYTLTLAGTGELVQTNVGDAPLSYVQGGGQILPALEQALLGHKADDEFEVSLAAVDAYGPVDPAAYREVELEQVPEEAREPGALLSAPGYQGSIRVHEVRDDVVVLDFNHPLAGEDLKFKIKVLSVADRPEALSPQENADGKQQ